ncbi:cell division cycle- protein, variant 2 [Balamuthia mandrillaris]
MNGTATKEGDETHASTATEEQEKSERHHEDKRKRWLRQDRRRKSLSFDSDLVVNLRKASESLSPSPLRRRSFEEGEEPNNRESLAKTKGEEERVAPEETPTNEEKQKKPAKKLKKKSRKGSMQEKGKKALALLSVHQLRSSWSQRNLPSSSSSPSLSSSLSSSSQMQAEEEQKKRARKEKDEEEFLRLSASSSSSSRRPSFVSLHAESSPPPSREKSASFSSLSSSGSFIIRSNDSLSPLSFGSSPSSGSKIRRKTTKTKEDKEREGEAKGNKDHKLQKKAQKELLIELNKTMPAVRHSRMLNNNNADFLSMFEQVFKQQLSESEDGRASANNIRPATSREHLSATDFEEGDADKEEVEEEEEEEKQMKQMLSSRKVLTTQEVEQEGGEARDKKQEKERRSMFPEEVVEAQWTPSSPRKERGRSLSTPIKVHNMKSSLSSSGKISVRRMRIGSDLTDKPQQRRKPNEEEQRKKKEESMITLKMQRSKSLRETNYIKNDQNTKKNRSRVIEYDIDEDSGMKVVTKASPHSLIQRAVKEKDRSDFDRQQFVDLLLITHKLYMTSAELLQSLLRIFGEDDDLANDSRTRVLSVLERWMRTYPSDYLSCNKEEEENEQDLLKLLQDWKRTLGSAASEDSNNTKKEKRKEKKSDIDRLLSLLDNLSAKRSQQQNQEIENEENRNESGAGETGSSSLHLEMAAKLLRETTPKELAQQLTLYDATIFATVTPQEFFNCAWTKCKHKAPNLSHMIQWFNEVSRWIMTQIVKTTDEKERVKVIAKFIQVGKEMMNLNNFNGTMMVLSALNNSAITRLTPLWQALPPKTIATFDAMQELLNPAENFRALREALLQSSPPLIPFMGYYLTKVLLLRCSPLVLPLN